MDFPLPTWCVPFFTMVYSLGLVPGGASPPSNQAGLVPGISTGRAERIKLSSARVRYTTAPSAVTHLTCSHVHFRSPELAGPTTAPQRPQSRLDGGLTWALPVIAVGEPTGEGRFSPPSPSVVLSIGGCVFDDGCCFTTAEHVQGPAAVERTARTQKVKHHAPLVVAAKDLKNILNSKQQLSALELPGRKMEDVRFLPTDQPEATSPPFDCRLTDIEQTSSFRAGNRSSFRGCQFPSDDLAPSDGSSQTRVKL
jgi:hypothetical protein